MKKLIIRRPNIALLSGGNQKNDSDHSYAVVITAAYKIRAMHDSEAGSDIFEFNNEATQ